MSFYSVVFPVQESDVFWPLDQTENFSASWILDPKPILLQVMVTKFLGKKYDNSIFFSTFVADVESRIWDS